jgi:hypothetical protein
MNHFQRHKLLLPGLGLALIFLSCKTVQERRLDEAAKKLDAIERSAEEWGRASISDIAWLDNRATKEGAGFFALGYSNPTSFYMDKARQNIQGSASLSISEEFSNALSAQFSPPSSGLPSGSGKGSASTNAPPLAASTNAPASGQGGGSTTGSSGSGSAPADKSSAASTSPPAGKTSTLTIQTNSQPVLAEDVVLKIGATDKVTERILDYISDPVRLPDNKKAYLGVMQVSLLPGWRTKKGYVAEVQVKFEYALSVAQASKRAKLWLKTHPEEKAIDPDRLGSVRSGDPEAGRLGLGSSFPSIISAFPFTESQILDLTSTYQRQLNFLAQLSGSVPQVPGLQAALRSAFKKMTQQSLATRNALPLVVPSSQGSEVTYRFDPELQALVAPASASSGPGQVLEPSSFPALIVAICADTELFTWDSIVTRVETRWIPVAHRGWFKKYSFDWWYYASTPERRLSNAERLENAYSFDSLYDQMKAMLTNGITKDFYAWKELDRRFENLRTMAMGRTFVSALPLVRPWVTGVYPARVRRDNLPPKVYIQGRYFKSQLSNLEKVGLQGMDLNPSCTPDGTQITATLTDAQKAQLAPGEYEIEILTSAGKTVWTNALTVLPTPKPVVDTVLARPLREHPVDPHRARPQRIEITGQNFEVGDQSLKVAIGGMVCSLSAAQVTDASLLIKMHDVLSPRLADEALSYRVHEVVAKVTDDSIAFVLDPDKLSLEPGKYDLVVVTSGGQTTISNAVQIAYEVGDDLALPAVRPVVSGVYPAKFRLDDCPEELTILGDFSDASPLQIQHAALGPIDLHVGPANVTGPHSFTVPLPRKELLPGTYHLALVNQGGQTVVSNAVEVLPVPAPAITAVWPMPLSLKKPAALKAKTEAAARESAPTSAAQPAAAPSDAPVQAPQQWFVQGTNFAVHDGSLRMFIGGVPLSGITTNITTTVTQEGSSYSTDTTIRLTAMDSFAIALTQDNVLLVEVSTNLANLLGAGKHELTVLTSGGIAGLSNAVTISAEAPKDRFAITAVYPNRGALYSSSVFGVIATNGAPQQGCLTVGKPGHQVNQVQKVIVGGRACPFWVISDTELVFTVPPWSSMVSTNDLSMATNKLDLVVVTTAAVAVLSNAIAFDLTLPNDFPHPFTLNAEEEKISRMLDTVFAAARALGTNPVLETDVRISAGAGPKQDNRQALQALEDLYELLRLRKIERWGPAGADAFPLPGRSVPPSPADDADRRPGNTPGALAAPVAPMAPEPPPIPSSGKEGGLPVAPTPAPTNSPPRTH